MAGVVQAKLNGRLGLGSDHGLLPKDCGYQFQSNPRGELTFLAGGPFADVRRHRCVNNYWIWIMVAWGQLLHGTNQYRWMTTYPDEVSQRTRTVYEHMHVSSGGSYRRSDCVFGVDVLLRAVGRQVDPQNRMSVDQRYHVNVLSRAHNFLALLETDPEMERLAIDPYCYLAVAMARTVLPAGVAPEARDTFLPDARDAQVSVARSAIQRYGAPVSRKDYTLPIDLHVPTCPIILLVRFAVKFAVRWRA